MPDRSRSLRAPPGGPAAPAAPAVAVARPVTATPDKDALHAGDMDESAAAYGNQAGVQAKPRSIADQVPSVLDLASVGGSFQLPADRELVGGWNPLSTGEGSRVSITMSSRSLRVSMWPPMV